MTALQAATLEACIRLLLIEDSPTDAALICHMLQDGPLNAQIAIHHVDSLKQGLASLRTSTHNIILLDLNLPDSDGFATFRSIHAAAPDIPVMVLTSYGSEELARLAVDQGAQDYLFKHRLDPYWVAQSIQHAIGRQDLLLRLRSVEAREVDRARKADRAKTDFLATMSHEIRTPIGAILMASDILLGEAIDNEERLEMTAMIHRSGEHLLTLVNEFLDLSKIEAGCLEVVPESVQLKQFIGGIVFSFQTLANKKGLRLHVEFDQALPEILRTDPTRLNQILSNLISNAVKFTSQGSVDVQVGVQTPEGGVAQLVVKVKDTGIGMSDAASQNLFRPYGQGDATVQRRFGGTGLGILLSRRLSSALGGSLELTTTRTGEGSTFTLTLPLVGQPLRPLVEMVKAGPKSSPPAPSLKGLRVLIVDDNIDNQRLVTSILKSAGAEVAKANDGVEGVDAAMRERFDVVLMDIQMPRMNGHSAIRELRAHGYPRPIVALSADGMSYTPEDCLKAGCNLYLLKPVAPRQLVSVVADLGGAAH